MDILFSHVHTNKLVHAKLCDTVFTTTAVDSMHNLLRQTNSIIAAASMSMPH
jgi:hypothetical protein